MRSARSSEPGRQERTSGDDIARAFALMGDIERSSIELRRLLMAIEARQATQPAPAPVITEPDPARRVAYRIAEAAERIGVSATTLRRAVNSGALATRRNGRRVIISEAALLAYAIGESVKA